MLSPHLHAENCENYNKNSQTIWTVSDTFENGTHKGDEISKLGLHGIITCEEAHFTSAFVS